MKDLMVAAALVVLLPGCAGNAADGALPASAGAPACSIDFTAAEEPARWRIIGDRMMLGSSDGAIVAHDGIGEFHGTVRRRLTGGWCSARRALDPALKLDEDFLVALTLRGDGKTYGFDLRDTADLDGIYWEATVAPPAGEWSDAMLTLDDFHALRRGSPVETDDTLDLKSIRSIAFVIARGQTGPYSLEVREVRFHATRPEP